MAKRITRSAIGACKTAPKGHVEQVRKLRQQTSNGRVNVLPGSKKAKVCVTFTGESLEDIESIMRLCGHKTARETVEAALEFYSVAQSRLRSRDFP